MGDYYYILQQVNFIEYPQDSFSFRNDKAFPKIIVQWASLNHIMNVDTPWAVPTPCEKFYKKLNKQSLKYFLCLSVDFVSLQWISKESWYIN